MHPLRRPDASILIDRGPGSDHWLIMGNAKPDDRPLRPALAQQLLRQAMQSRTTARALSGLLYSLGELTTDVSGDDLWRRLLPWLERGRLRVVERPRVVPHVLPTDIVLRPAPPVEYVPHPLEPIADDLGPTHTRFVALVIRHYEGPGKGKPISNLPLFVDHKNGRVDQGQSNKSGELKVEQLPPDHRWSVFSTRNPSSKS